METDWREILKFSQKDLKQVEKEKLCDNLSWMDTDDIELNFSDLKILFKLAQDVLKYKTEQVNGLIGKSKRKIKTKDRSTITDHPTMNSDSVLEAITHQEEVIKANKDIIEQLYSDIAELEGRKVKYEKINFEDQSSESSRNTLSEINAIAQLEGDITKKNKHIRKLLHDVKVLEEENTTLREKLTIFKEKLKESTILIENLTEQLFALNKDNSKLKEALGVIEQEKANLVVEVENLRGDVSNNNMKYEKIEEDIRTKLQQLRSSVKSHKIEIERLSQENSELKENLTNLPKSVTSPKKKSSQEEHKIKELQEKLTEASEQMLQSANLIQVLKNENEQLKAVIEEIPDSVLEQKNISDDGKEKQMIIKLKNKVQSLYEDLNNSEEIIAAREQEVKIAEINSQLQLIKSDEGINALIESIKNKKRNLKLKDEGIKSLVQEVNQLNEQVNYLQLENETMRERLQIPVDERIETYGILKKIMTMEKENNQIAKKILEYENKLISVELENRDKDEKILKLKTIIGAAKIDVDKFNNVEIEDKFDQNNIEINNNFNTEQIQAIIEENEGLRNGLTDILNFLKDSKSSSGVLLMECPTLEALLNSMEIRKAAGWFSPHMKTVMELKAALGGKDALMNALHESRKETYQILDKLSKQEQKSLELENKLEEIKTKTTIKIPTEDKISSTTDISIGEFGSWMLNVDEKIDIKNHNEIQNIITKGNILFESQYKQALQYFEKKFSLLFEKFTSLVITSSDEINNNSIKEEHYKAEIENLRSQLEENEDDTSNQSPGLLNVPKLSFSSRKYNYLEESYKQIRTINENIKIELLECKKEKMIKMSAYERKIQKLILSIINLTDKLRNSIPMDLFLKQNDAFNELVVKYKNVAERNTNTFINSMDLNKRLEEDKMDLIRRFHNHVQNISKSRNVDGDKILNEIEQSILQKQLKQICVELENKNIEIEKLQKNIEQLQILQAEITNKMIYSESNEDIHSMKEQIKKYIESNNILKEQYQDVKNQLDTVRLQLQSYQHKELNNEMEVNMLRHQILDLQSAGDNKAVIARLSSEVLLSQMQASESQERLEELKIALSKEKHLRAETEEILMNRQNVFDIYANRYEIKIRKLTEILDALRQQYQGSLPIISIETLLEKIEDYHRKSCEVEEKLADIENLRSDLMTKHTIYNQLLDLSSGKCFEDNDVCPHKMKNIITEETQKLEMDHYKKNLLSFDQTHKKLLERCSFLEKTLLLLNQGFKINNSPAHCNKKQNNKDNDIEIEDVISDDDSSSKGNRTLTLSHPKTDVNLLKKNMEKDHQDGCNDTINHKPLTKHKNKIENRQTQTPTINFINTDIKYTQTETDLDLQELKNHIEKLLSDIKQKDKIIKDIASISEQYKQITENMTKDKEKTSVIIKKLKDSNNQKEEGLKKLENLNSLLKKEAQSLKLNQQTEINKINDTVNEDNQSLVEELKRIEKEKNVIVAEYKQLLIKERNDYSESLKEMQTKLKEMQAKLDNEGHEVITASDDVKETSNKYTLKICELEDECFKLKSDLDSCEAEFKTQQSEMERWKNLATERLIRMEQLSAQIKERHNHEMESYKAENQHWLSQLNETQREHMELRVRLTEQKTLYMKQITEKDGHIEQLRSIINNLKSQMLNMQTMLTINDPSFDLSAIVEVEELSDQQSDRLELKCESSIDFNDSQEDLRMPCTSTAIWQEPVIERLRREKQLMSKQNAILRRQIKAIAARERRSRLDAQNLKNQVFRISTSGNKLPSAETTALHSKIASLQAQLAAARRDATSSLALWDKCKRAQQASERWQARYEEKCQEVNKLESSLSLAKSAVTRLEKEKRILLTKLNDDKHTEEKRLALEKQDAEASEKESRRSGCEAETPVPVSESALSARVEAQQRRIAALELAERGNESLVNEYERSLAEITALKGQMLKLESTLLEAQIKSPMKNDMAPELEYWKNYCDMLKEENTQLTIRISALETSAAEPPQRVAQLQRTVLTLRGLVSKLQAEQKSLTSNRRGDSRPGSAKSGTDKTRSNEESYRTEITNLKKSIMEKDELLQKCKEMLNMAMEKNDRLSMENMFLRERLEELTE